MDNIVILAFAGSFGLFIYLLSVSILKQVKKVDINTQNRLDSLTNEKSLMEEEIEKIRITRKKDSLK